MFAAIRSALLLVRVFASAPCCHAPEGRAANARGPDSRKVIGRLMGGLGHEGWRLICLKGNHEDIMWQTCCRKVLDCG